MEASYSSIPNTQYFLRRYGLLSAFGVVVLAAILYFYYLDPQATTAVLASTVRHSTPLVLGALCGLLNERAGPNVKPAILHASASGAKVSFSVFKDF